MDALGDVGRAVTASITTDALLAGIGLRSVVTLAAVALTSYNVTKRSTAWSRRLKAGPVNPVPPDLSK